MKINHILITSNKTEPFAWVHFTEKLQRAAENHCTPKESYVTDIADLWFPIPTPFDDTQLGITVHATMLKHKLIEAGTDIMLTNFKPVDLGDGKACIDVDIERA